MKTRLMIVSVLAAALIGGGAELADEQAAKVPSPRPSDKYEFDAVLLVGGKPDGLEAPSLDMALKARKACQLMLEGKAPYLVISGKQFNRQSKMARFIAGKQVKFPVEWEKVKAARGIWDWERLKRDRIRACDMLVLMAFSRGIGRLAIRMEPDPAKVPNKCGAYGIKKLLCVGDGAGPERPAVEALKAAGAQVRFVAPYATLAEGKTALQNDCTLTEADRAYGPFKQLPKKVGLIMIMGMHFHTHHPCIQQAVKMYKAGMGQYIMSTGNRAGFMCIGETTAIIAVGFGVPIERIAYDSCEGTSKNVYVAARFCKRKGLKDMVCLSRSHGGYQDSPQWTRDGIQCTGYYVPAFDALVPRDGRQKVKKVLAAYDSQVARLKAAVKPDTPEHLKKWIQAAVSTVEGTSSQNRKSRRRRRDYMMQGFFAVFAGCNFPGRSWQYDGFTDDDEMPRYGKFWRKNATDQQKIHRYLQLDLLRRTGWDRLMDVQLKKSDTYTLDRMIYGRVERGRICFLDGCCP